MSKSFNITLHELRAALKRLRNYGYSADRVRTPEGDHESDPMVLIERTDGAHWKEIMRGWKR